MPEVLHHLRAVQGLVDQYAGAGGVDRGLRCERSGGRKARRQRDCLHDGDAFVMSLTVLVEM